jgi:hypothetical protein
MSYQEPATYKESATRLLALADRLLSIKKATPYSDQDARGVGLTNCRLACLNSVIILNILTMGEENRISGEDFKTLVGMTAGTAQNASEILEKIQRLSLLIIFQFQIENLLKNILREAWQITNIRGFYNIAGRCVSSFQDSAQKHSILYIPERIRNSLHSNGIHHGQNAVETIDGYKFEFIDGQKVSCAGWGGIILSLDSSVSIVEEILALSDVQALADPIMDHYAWEEDTRP